MNSDTRAITVLGVGAMGTRIATRLAAAGHTLTVWNRAPEPPSDLARRTGATVADTARSSVAAADVVVSMVSDDEASTSVWLDPGTGVLECVPSGAVVIESSTITRDMATALKAAADRAGLAFPEAPVVGSRPQAEAGALVPLVGGDAETLARGSVRSSTSTPPPSATSVPPARPQG